MSPTIGHHWRISSPRSRQTGEAIILAPDGPWNYSTLDRVLGHQPHYTRETLTKLPTIADSGSSRSQSSIASAHDAANAAQEALDSATQQRDQLESDGAPQDQIDDAYQAVAQARAAKEAADEAAQTADDTAGDSQ